MLVVDDGSTDRTRQTAIDAGARVATLPVNCGYGAALQTGFMYSRQEGFSFVAQMDSDGQHLGSFMPAVLEPILAGEADLAIGSRFLNEDGHYEPTIARRVGMEFFGRVASFLMRQPITDPTSGYQAMTSQVAEMYCSEIFPSDYPDADVLVLMHRLGMRIREVPVQMLVGKGPSMHDGHRSIYYVYKMTLSILLNLIRGMKSNPADAGA